MGKLDLHTETKLLLAKQIIEGYSCSLDFTNWAVRLMLNGYSSENLHILAGLDDSSFWTIDSFFRKTLDDFNINSNIQKKELLDFYLIYHIKKVLDSPETLTIDIIRLLGEVIYDTSYYPNKHLNFFFLYDELEELTGISREEYALNEFKTFIDELENKQ